MKLSHTRKYSRYFYITPMIMAFATPAIAVQQDNPTFWVEAPEFNCTGGLNIDPGMRGRASQDPRFSLNVRVDIAYQKPNACSTGNRILNGADAADEVIDRLASHPRPTGKLAIEFIRLGNVPPSTTGYESQVVKLFFHPQDGLRGAWAGLTENSWATPWMSHGIAETKVWVQQFIARYKARQLANPLIPNPNRFIFDNEISMGYSDAPYVYLFMKHDLTGRWSTEIVPGTGKTMAQLEAEYLSNRNNKPYNYDNLEDPNNTVWTMWYNNLTRKAISGASREAIYSLLEAAWPNVKTTNYGYYSTDGVNDPNTPPFAPREMSVHDLTAYDTFQRSASVAFESMHAPLFYSPWILYGNNVADYTQSYENYMRYQIEAIRYSFGGIPTTNIAPWIALNQLSWESTPVMNPANGSISSTRLTITRDWNRTALALFRAYGISEINVFAPTSISEHDSSANSGGWADMNDIVNQVWAFDLEFATKGAANTAISPLEIAYTNNNPILDSGATTQVITKFLPRSTVALPGRLHINTDSIGSRAQGTVSSVISIQRSNGTWLDINTASAMPTTSKRWLQSFDVPGNTADYLQSDGRIVVRLQHRPLTGSGNISSKFELIQLIGIDGGSVSTAVMAPPPPPSGGKTAGASQPATTKSAGSQQAMADTSSKAAVKTGNMLGK